MTQRPHKRAFLTASIGSVSLASGNPVGDPVHWGSAIDAMAREGPRQRLVPRRDGCGELGAAAYTEAGLTALEIGDEAILDMRGVLAQRPRHEVGPAVRQPAATPRIHHDCGPSR